MKSRNIIPGKIRSRGLGGMKSSLSTGQKKKKTQENWECLKLLWIQLPHSYFLSFQLQCGSLPLCLYHCWYCLEGLSSLGSAFHVCCFVSSHSSLQASALGSSDSPPEIPTSAPPAQSQPESRADLCLCTWVSWVGSWVRSSVGVLGRAIPRTPLFSGGQTLEGRAPARGIKNNLLIAESKGRISSAFWHTLHTMSQRWSWAACLEKGCKQPHKVEALHNPTQRYWDFSWI